MVTTDYGKCGGKILRFPVVKEEKTKNSFDETAVVESLDYPYPKVQVTALIQIVKGNISNAEVIFKLIELSKCRNEEIHKVFGKDTIGHYSIAALQVLNTYESTKAFEDIMNELEEREQNIIKRIVQNFNM